MAFLCCSTYVPYRLTTTQNTATYVAVCMTHQDFIRIHNHAYILAILACLQIGMLQVNGFLTLSHYKHIHDRIAMSVK